MTNSEVETNRILGSLGTRDGKGVVRMEDTFATDIDDLWSALTDPSRLARWIGEVKGDLRLGGEFRAHFFTSDWEGTGRIEACEPPKRLMFVSQDASLPYEMVTDATLIAEGQHTRLIVEERGMPLDHVADYGAGIQAEVENLGCYLTGRVLVDFTSRWGELQPIYKKLLPDLGDS